MASTFQKWTDSLNMISCSLILTPKAKWKVVGDDERRRLTPKSSKSETKIFHFLFLWGIKVKNRFFKKFSKSADFLYSGVFGYGEHEYEGIFATGDSLLVMCKNCEEDSRKEVSIHSLKLNDSGRLIHHSQWLIDVSNVPLTSINKKIKFHPSCLSRNPVTGEWYIISAVNRILIVLDEQWRIRNHYPLDAATFKQPEGITFDAAGDLFISNEGQEGDANLLFFKYDGSVKN